MKILLLLFYSLLLAACSTSQIMKDCSKVEQKDFFVCKNIKPWE